MTNVETVPKRSEADGSRLLLTIQKPFPSFPGSRSRCTFHHSGPCPRGALLTQEGAVSSCPAGIFSRCGCAQFVLLLWTSEKSLPLSSPSPFLWDVQDAVRASLFNPPLNSAYIQSPVFAIHPFPCVWLQTCSEGRTLLKALLIRLMVPSQLLHRPQGPRRLPHLVFCPSQCLWRDIRTPGFCPKKGKESLSSVCDAFPDSWKS